MMDERKDARTDGRTWATLNALPHSTNSGGIKITYIYGSRGGGQGSGPHPMKNHKHIGFRNTGLDPLKIHKATKPAFNVGPSSARPRMRFAGVPMMARF